MLVTLQGGNSISETLPGKVQSYMAAGKVVIGAINGETKDVIDEAKCGFCGKADDADELAQNVRNFIEFKDKDELERNSYKYYLDNFEKEKFVNKLVSELDKLTK
jgi:glycosyltransferase involved in cell wall biosynthesis